MLHIALLTASLAVSASFQTPSELPNPVNYEFAAGTEIVQGLEAWTWVERENGVIYTGVDTRGSVRPWKVLKGRAAFQNRQAQDILRGEVGADLCYGYARNGIVQIWDHCDPATALHFGIESPHMRLGTNLYKDGLESAYAKAFYEKKVNERISLVPTFEYAIDRNKTEFMQGKVVLKFKM